MSEKDKETITIPLKEYKDLQRQSFMLTCLESGGVDNWDWYSESLKEYFEKEDTGEWD